jgi:hypothetical protein
MKIRTKIIEGEQLLGLEEWHSKSKQYLTTIVCSNSYIVVKDPEQIEFVKDLFKIESYQIINNQLCIPAAKVFKIKREAFEKIVSGNYSV